MATEKQPHAAEASSSSPSSDKTSVSPSELLSKSKDESPPSSRSDDETSQNSRSSADVSSGLLANNDRGSKDILESDQGLVHGHTLPRGWTCKYYANSDRYEFEFNPDAYSEDHPMAKTPTTDTIVQTSRRPTLNLFECQYGYHFPSTPTPSMISDLAKQVQKIPTAAPSGTQPKGKQISYGKSKITLLSDEDEQARRLRDIFPTATGPIIEQMIRIYHGREGLIKAALISLGYKRATEYSTQQKFAQSPIMLMMSKPASKKLFDKLVGYFPDKDETLIKELMFKHREVEHEIISALVESSQDSSDLVHSSRFDGLKPKDKNGAIMKLRYLKFLYPSCQEIELYHLLHCNYLNVQKVMEEVERKGHKRANIEEVLQNRKSQTQQMKAQQAAHAAKEKATISPKDYIEAYKKRTRPVVTEARANHLKDSLKKSFEDQPEEWLLKALESVDYNEGLAKKFLEEMEPIDDALYKQRYQIYHEEESHVVAFPCKSIQKDGINFMSIVANENVYIPREVIECQTALALLKVDASTFTQDDFPPIKFTYRQGRTPNLANGSTFRAYMKIRESHTTGPNRGLRAGSKYNEICLAKDRPKPNGKAIGRNKTLTRGRNLELKYGPNRGLLQRDHPFFST